ncbi:hypothetical protein [Winogradskyella flava]|uniref:Uncharacterized protein n=1 Tax=Winogradskyella flava TaxID=1884876 RepID=A0A842IU65_9FLAO|nr:hypothetical protein [Winogradskyella flava]MBC2845689.1 hypothetical protein [Winogradskyella flava]
MENIEYIIIASIFILVGIYFFKLEKSNIKWKLCKSDALYYYVCKFFEKKGFEVCKIDLPIKGDYQGKTHSQNAIAQEELFIRKIIVMDTKRRKYETLVKVKHSHIFGTHVKLLKKRNFVE